MTNRRRRALLPFPAILALGLVIPFGVKTADPQAATAPRATPSLRDGEAAYRSLPQLPRGAVAPGASGVVPSAIELAATLHAVPVARGSTDGCPRHRLQVSWQEPGPSYGHGALVSPLGPAPTDATTRVNGVVTCAASDWAFMGFEARYVDGRWDVTAVPYVDEEIDDHAEAVGTHHHGAGDEHGHGEATTARPVDAAPIPAPYDFTAAAIEGYAPYEPQRTCDPSAKPGTLALQQHLMGGAPGSRNLGIVRACGLGGTSEHKEGRAFDWGVLVHRPAERAAAESFIGRVLATDEAGNRHALARRMGVMYLIWDHKIWSANRPNEGWRPYSGRSPHTDHVHISLSWDGAMGRTSFWSGLTAGGLLPAPAPGSAIVAAPIAFVDAPRPAQDTSEPHHEREHEPSEDDDHDGRRHDGREDAAALRKAAEQADRQARKAAVERWRAAEQAAKEERKAAQERWKAAEEIARRDRHAAREHAKAIEEAARRRQDEPSPSRRAPAVMPPPEPPRAKPSSPSDEGRGGDRSKQPGREGGKGGKGRGGKA